MSSETWRYGQDWPAADGEEWTTLIVPHEDERGMDDRRLALPKWFVAVIVRDHEQARLVARYAEALRLIAEPPKAPRSTGARLMEGDDARGIAREALSQAANPEVK